MRVNILRWSLTSLMVEISNLQATGINEFFRGLCSRQCHSTGNNFGCMTFITWPPLAHSWLARKLVASIDTLRFSHLYVLYFTVWDFTSSLFSRRLVRVKARERGLQPALSAERFGRGRSCLSVSQCLLNGKPQPGASYPAAIQLKWELLLSCFAAIALRIPFWKWSSSGVAAALLQGGSPLPAAGLQDGLRFLPRKALGFL